MVLGGTKRRFALLAVITLLGYYYILPSKTQSSAVTKSPVTQTSGSFYWKDLPLKYPQDTIVPLPTKRPAKQPAVQHTFGPEEHGDAVVRKLRQKTVKDAFLRCWGSYKKLAWGADELTPKTGKPKHNYGGWGASLVDNLDTLWIMGLKDEFKVALEAALEIKFVDSTLERVNVFETTIRYLGGFLSAYDLCGDARLLDKAAELGDMLLVAFDTPNHLPITRWRIDLARAGEAQEADTSVLLAEVGSLSMEFTRLSQRTGDNRYYSAIETVTATLHAQQNQTKLPGLWPTFLNGMASDFVSNNHFTLGGRADSAYEYLPKMHALLGGADARYAEMWHTAANAALKHLIHTPMVPSTKRPLLISMDILADQPGLFLHPQGQHLTCFLGGVFALSSRLLSLPSHLPIARALTDGCLWASHATPTGIMPELFTVATCPTPDCPWDATAYRAAVAKAHDLAADDAQVEQLLQRLPAGMTNVPDTRYGLRPEVAESLFVLWRVTGDKHWADEAWALFEKVVATSRTELANGLVADVTVPAEQVATTDSMESFWMAETLKYFYLIFSEPELLSLDEWVFNTEAHAFLRPKV